MAWPDSFADSFPAPRDDEPESLRQDIADELADHLQCAVDRHLLSNPDLDTARSRALQRFGDPRRVARQLWFDALRERIMSQRILLAVSVMMTLTCVAAIAIGWRVAEAGRLALTDLVEQNRVSTEAMQMTNVAMLARLEGQAGGNKDVSSLEWGGIKLRLVSTDGNRLPDGYGANLMGNLLEVGKNMNLSGEITPDGTLDFGLVRTGQHHLNIGAPFGDTYSRIINVLPGKNIDEVLKCPGALPGEAGVSISIDWPDDLKDRGYWAVCGFRPMARATADPGKGIWTIAPPAGEGQVVVIDPNGLLVRLDPTLVKDRPQDPITNSFGTYQGASPGSGALPLLLPLHGVVTGHNKPDPKTVAPGLRIQFTRDSDTSGSRLQWIFGFPPSKPNRSAQFRGNRYRLVSFFVMKSPDESKEGPNSHATVVAGFASWDYSNTIVFQKGSTPEGLLKLPMPTTDPLDAVPGVTSTWKISIPEEVLQQLRASEK
jgi:hypothetical protein